MKTILSISLSFSGKRMKSLFGALLLLLSVFPAGAQTDTTAVSQGANFDWSNLSQSDWMFLLVVGMVVVVALLVLLVAVYTMHVLKVLLIENKKEKAIAAGATAEELEAMQTPSLWERLKGKMTDAVPIEEEETVMLDHDYDGIRELDNHLPPWWKWLFYVTIVFGVIYLLNYHVFHWSPLQKEEYKREMASAALAIKAHQAQMANSIDETNVEKTSEQAALDKGSEIFQQNCAVCHGKEAQGMVGPNLTDQYWIHGGDIKDLFKTIKYGVPEKGMISWQSKLRPVEIRDVASYVLSLQGSNPPNPKEPQGDLYKPAAAQADTTATQNSDTTAVMPK